MTAQTTLTASTPITTHTQPAPQNSFGRDTRIVFTRQLRQALRNPAWVIIGLSQPLLYLFLFGPLLTPLASSLGARNAYTFFVPGILVQLALFGSLFVGFGLVAEWRQGVIEAERVTPASRLALLSGRLLRDQLLLAVQALLLVGFGYLVGMRAPAAGVIVGVALVVVLGGACASFSYALALATRSEDALAPILNTVSMPILLLSGILLPMTLGPRWLQTASDLMPFKHIVDAVRLSFSDGVSTSNLWAGALSVVLLAAAGGWWARSQFRRDSA